MTFKLHMKNPFLPDIARWSFVLGVDQDDSFYSDTNPFSKDNDIIRKVERHKFNETR